MPFAAIRDLLGADERGTLAAMRAHRAEFWNPVIEQYDGRVIGTAGDSLLIEYASAVAAVESSVAVQRGMIERNADIPDARRMLLWTGINIGEVVTDGDDIFRDGINVVAARRSAQRNPNFSTARRILAAALAQLGKAEQALAAVQQLL